MSMDGTFQELPKYQSHKQVWALKILHVEPLHGESEDVGAMITPLEDGYAAFPVSPEYVKKHDPKPDGYYVVYEDGYQSWSPSEAFESGYSRIK